MNSMTDRFAASPDANAGLRSTLRRTIPAVAAFVALAAAAPQAIAQSAPPQRSFEVRPTVGVFVPTGKHRDLLKDAAIVGAQASYLVASNVALVASFGWAPTKDQALADEKVDLFQYDIGVEWRMPDLATTGGLVTRPYVAIGGGGRTYDYRDLDNVGTQTNFLGFGALGLDVGRRNGRVGLRIEARDNVTAFKGLQGELGDRKARNDLQFTAGLTLAY